MKKTPLEIAEQIVFRVEGVPWPLTAFLEKTRAESLKVHTFKPEEEEAERMRRRSDPNIRELGTYTAGISVRDVTQDVLDVMRLFR